MRPIRSPMRLRFPTWQLIVYSLLKKILNKAEYSNDSRGKYVAEKQISPFKFVVSCSRAKVHGICICPMGNLKPEYTDYARGCYALPRVLCFPCSFARQITIRLFQTLCLYFQVFGHAILANIIIKHCRKYPSYIIMTILKALFF